MGSAFQLRRSLWFMYPIEQTYRFFRPQMYARLHRNVGSDVADALQQWVQAGAGRSYAAKGRVGEAVLYEVTLPGSGADEARRSLDTLCDVQFMACEPLA